MLLRSCWDDTDVVFIWWIIKGPITASLLVSMRLVKCWGSHGRGLTISAFAIYCIRATLPLSSIVVLMWCLCCICNHMYCFPSWAVLSWKRDFNLYRPLKCCCHLEKKIILKLRLLFIFVPMVKMNVVFPSPWGTCARMQFFPFFELLLLNSKFTLSKLIKERRLY